MTRLPDISGKKLIRVLKRAGWKVTSQRGSHVKMTKEGRRNFLIIPVHARKSVPKGTLYDIIKDAGLSVCEFIDLMN